MKIYTRTGDAGETGLFDGRRVSKADLRVDAYGEEKFYELLKGLKEQQGLTIVIVTHDIAVVSAHVEKLACLNQTLYTHASPAEVITAGTLEKVYGCEVELLAHGRIPHRVLEEHK